MAAAPADAPTDAPEGFEDFPPDPSLRDPLPEEPLALFGRWLHEARDEAAQPNPDSMTVATVEPDGRPSARVVLCRGFDPAAGFVVFYTNYHSDKGKALQANPRATGVLHWDAKARQVRLAGPVTKSPPAESDAYWERRPRPSRIAAWASSQSAPIASRRAFLDRLAEAEAKYAGGEGGAVPRPSWWGGYRIWIARMELWVGSAGRAHDRALWTRDLERQEDGYRGGPWTVRRLQP